jgi:hypothetical protein
MPVATVMPGAKSQNKLNHNVHNTSCFGFNHETKQAKKCFRRSSLRLPDSNFYQNGGAGFPAPPCSNTF